MKLSQFDFKLPTSQVALWPHSIRKVVTNDAGEERTFYLRRPDECKMVVVHKKSKTIDMYKTELPPKVKGKKQGKPVFVKDENGEKIFLRLPDIFDYFQEDDMFVFNNTKVFPARLYGTKEKTDAKIEVFLLRELNQEMRLWDVLVEPARKIRIGNKLFFNDEGTLVAEVIDNTTSRGRTLRFLYDCPHDVFKERLFNLGEPPLPRYIIDHKDKEGHLDRPVTEDDYEYFQNVYAEVEGATTAPSTGLHFTRQMLKRMDIHGIRSAFITLHCGLGNFHEIEVEDLSKHKMDSEELHVSEETCNTINTAKKEGHRICAIGASVLKGTETVVGTDGYIKAFDGWTNKFIFPPYEYGLADCALVNLYHPMSAMMMATCAFGGYDIVYEAYVQAQKAGYKFGCFGDVMLIVND